MKVASKKEKLYERMYSECAASSLKTAEWMGLNPTLHQRQLFEAVDSGAEWIAAKSGQGCGKSAALGVIGVHWLFQGGYEVKIPLTAPTMRQCQEAFTGELARTLDQAHPAMRRVVEVSQSRVTVAGRKKWAIIPITASKPESAQGLHHKNMKILVDECSGISRPIMEQWEGTLTNEGGRLVATGNPNLRDCWFFDCFHGKKAHRFLKLTFNAEESPLVSKKTLQQKIEDYGRDSDFYRVRVLGEFPHQDARAIIAYEDCLACMKLDKYAFAAQSKRRAFGVDFARFGDCENVIATRQGNAIIKIQTWAHTDPNDVAEYAMAAQEERMWQDRDTRYILDAGGIGQGVMRRFYDQGKNVYEFHFGRKINHADYTDVQTQAWFQLAKRIKLRQVALPHDERLLHQLTTRNQTEPKKDGKLQVEAKKDYEKRGNESPDRADAVVMAMFEETESRGQFAAGTLSGKMRQHEM